MRRAERTSLGPELKHPSQALDRLFYYRLAAKRPAEGLQVALFSTQYPSPTPCPLARSRGGGAGAGAGAAAAAGAAISVFSVYTYGSHERNAMGVLLF